MELPPRSKDEGIVTPLTLLRYLVGGAYLGFATIAAAYWWYIFDPSGPRLTYFQVTHWMQQPEEIKKIFDNDLPSTLAMSVLVIVEMFSAFTAISERQSILKMPPWKNWYLLAAVVGSLLVHILTLELAVTQRIFSVVHLDLRHWKVVILLGVPTLIIEEIFKAYVRATTKKVVRR
jgi:Ca2+ transporting ATPase